MAFTVAATGSGASSGGAAILCGNSTTATPYTPLSHLALPSSSSRTRRSLHLVSAKKLSRPRRSDLNIPETTTTIADQEPQWTAEIGAGTGNDGYPDRALPGSEVDFFEGPQWDTVGLMGEYLWVAGVVFAILAGLFGAANYNQGASDFKDTPAYKESVQSRELLEQPDASDSDVFESNPTEVAPSLE
ncbi:uncharacterized protein LOC130738908 [Lotus japonicus]|uniref:uncharacterized protein LOC130738908 n=1 Tax=Lotus japonicus TaxID=34305 RepID=UPI0025851348|nr:uncharacterized protein LOC130738908 [Lotus japonicus]